MNIPNTVIFGIVVVLVIAIVVIASTQAELEKTRRVLLVADKRAARQARKEAEAQKVAKYLTPVPGDTGVSEVPKTQDGIVPWSAIANVYDQFTGGYIPIGTARAQADDNDNTFVLMAKPADSRHLRFWYRITCAVSDRHCDIYLPEKGERKNSGEILTVPELPNDSPLIVAVTEAKHLYG